MSDIVEEATEALAETKCSDEMVDFFRVGLVRELAGELYRLHCWAGLMELLDEHWPEDIFPTVEGDDERRDAGVRIVSLLRWVDRLQAVLFQVEEARVDYDAALHRREHGAVASQRFVNAVLAVLDREDT